MTLDDLTAAIREYAREHCEADLEYAGLLFHRRNLPDTVIIVTPPEPRKAAVLGLGDVRVPGAS